MEQAEIVAGILDSIEGVAYWSITLFVPPSEYASLAEEMEGEVVLLKPIGKGSILVLATEKIEKVEEIE